MGEVVQDGSRRKYIKIRMRGEKLLRSVMIKANEISHSYISCLLLYNFVTREMEISKEICLSKKDELIRSSQNGGETGPYRESDIIDSQSLNLNGKYS